MNDINLDSLRQPDGSGAAGRPRTLLRPSLRERLLLVAFGALLAMAVQSIVWFAARTGLSGNESWPLLSDWDREVSQKQNAQASDAREAMALLNNPNDARLIVSQAQLLNHNPFEQKDAPVLFAIGYAQILGKAPASTELSAPAEGMQHIKLAAAKGNPAALAFYVNMWNDAVSGKQDPALVSTLTSTGLYDPEFAALAQRFEVDRNEAQIRGTGLAKAQCLIGIPEPQCFTRWFAASSR